MPFHARICIPLLTALAVSAPSAHAAPPHKYSKVVRKRPKKAGKTIPKIVAKGTPKKVVSAGRFKLRDDVATVVLQSITSTTLGVTNMVSKVGAFSLLQPVSVTQDGAVMEIAAKDLSDPYSSVPVAFIDLDAGWIPSGVLDVECLVETQKSGVKVVVAQWTKSTHGAGVYGTTQVPILAGKLRFLAVWETAALQGADAVSLSFQPIRASNQGFTLKECRVTPRAD